MESPEKYLPPETIALLKKQHYALFGHSAAKLCHWTKRSLYPGDTACYKQKFYGINSHRCLQMSPAVAWCQHQCGFCWRPHTALKPELKACDGPEEIAERSIEMQRILLSGYGALKDQIGEKKLEEARNPKHVAISLSGEPTLYPKLSELIDAYHARGLTTFLVTNGMRPEMLESMSMPTQLYLSIEAPNEALHRKINAPVIKGSWKRLSKTIEIFPALKTRKAIRVTLMRGLNMQSGKGNEKGIEKEFAEIIARAKPDFVELKSYMFVGYSRQRLKQENMPLHNEVREFAEKVNNHLNYTLAGVSEPSRVVLLWNGKTERKIKLGK